MVVLSILLSPFMSSDLVLQLTGITNYANRSVDLFKIRYYKIFTVFNLPKFDLNIRKKGFEPLGGGCVVLKTKKIRRFDAVNLSSEEKINKIRVFVITARNRVWLCPAVDIKNQSWNYLADTKIKCIAFGSACSLLGESINGVYFETVSGKETLEKMAEACCIEFLTSINESRLSRC